MTKADLQELRQVHGSLRIMLATKDIPLTQLIDRIDALERDNLKLVNDLEAEGIEITQARHRIAALEAQLAQRDERIRKLHEIIEKHTDLHCKLCLGWLAADRLLAVPDAKEGEGK